MNVRKTCIMTLQQFKHDGTRRRIKGGKVSNTGLDITIRNQKVEVVEDLLYLGCYITRDQTIAREIDARLPKDLKALNIAVKKGRLQDGKKVQEFATNNKPYYRS
jgi:hypothetical protein